MPLMHEWLLTIYLWRLLRIRSNGTNRGNATNARMVINSLPMEIIVAFALMARTLVRLFFIISFEINSKNVNLLTLFDKQGIWDLASKC